MRLWVIVVMLILGAACQSFADNQSFVDYCANGYKNKQTCPSECKLQCIEGSNANDCAKVCIPQECQSFGSDNCPVKFCDVATECSKEKFCMPKIAANQLPACGNLGFSGPDNISCCSGYVKKCGFDYMDGSCNMDGKNTAYRFPICIPCGDGVCTNFENHCNCPEDCKKEIIPLN